MVTRRPHPTHTTARLRQAAAALGALRVRRVAVHGTSMEPVLRAGDRVLVVPARRLRPGDLVAARDPRRPDRILIKRVLAGGPRGFDLRGDNPTDSTDSRQFGPVPRGMILGRVVYRYAPPGRSGRLPGTE